MRFLYPIQHNPPASSTPKRMTPAVNGHATSLRSSTAGRLRHRTQPRAADRDRAWGEARGSTQQSRLRIPSYFMRGASNIAVRLVRRSISHTVVSTFLQEANRSFFAGHLRDQLCPSEPPERNTMRLTTPITSPARLNIGPPERPRGIQAGTRSTPSRCDRQVGGLHLACARDMDLRGIVLHGNSVAVPRRQVVRRASPFGQRSGK